MAVENKQAISLPLSFGSDLDEWPWKLAIGVAITDILTTWIGVVHFGFTEANPLASLAFTELGLLIMFPLKITAILFAVVVAGLCHDKYDWMIPVGISFPWLIASLINILSIALAL